MANIRVGVSLPEELLNDLSFAADRLGITRSSLLSQLCLEPVKDLRNLLETIPANPTDQDVLRFRGKSAEVIERRLSDLRDMENDLFSSKD